MATNNGFVKIRVVAPSKELAEFAAVRVAKAFTLGHVDGEIIQGQRGDWLAFIDVAITPEELEETSP